jgi:hypothetical protein
MKFRALIPQSFSRWDMADHSECWSISVETPLFEITPRYQKCFCIFDTILQLVSPVGQSRFVRGEDISQIGSCIFERIL